MELWERDDIDMLHPAHIRFNRDGTGEFQFTAVQGEIDCRFGERDGRPIVEFSWSGSEEMDQSCGRGWATLGANDELDGRLFFHLGDDSAFTAVREREAHEFQTQRRSAKNR
jgi:hypothetical protein